MKEQLTMNIARNLEAPNGSMGLLLQREVLNGEVRYRAIDYCCGVEIYYEEIGRKFYMESKQILL